MKEFKRHLVTAALPYANGPVHIGHLAGVYIPADIYVRYLRMNQQDVLFVCGSDEHGVPITIKAKKEGCTPQDIVNRYHQIIKQSFADFGIEFSNYSRTSNALHHNVSSGFFKTLYEKGEFIEQESEQYFDAQANQFLADRYITGTCPKCSSEGAYGDQCEKCGSSLSPLELINPISTITGQKPVLKKTKHWYLPLDKHEQFLREWILQGHTEWKSNVYGQCKSWIDGGLQPRAVSRDLDWGVPVPVEGAEGKVLYVWFDAPIGYITSTQECTKDWEKYWKSEDCKLVHFIGKDNIVFHCIVFPAMLKAHGDYILPENVPANEFLNLENDKISTSRNWAVWLHEYLTDFKDQQDTLRYVLTANAPETKDNDFTWKDFQARNNNELVAILGNFVNRVVVLTHKYFQGTVPAKTTLLGIDTDMLAEISTAKQAVAKNIENYKFREALKDAMQLARAGNKYLTETEPWKVIKTDEQRVATILHVCLQITANLGIIIEPFLPFTAKKIQTMFGMNACTWNQSGNVELLQTGTPIGEAALLFRKIEDSEIDAQIEKLQQTKQAMNTNVNKTDVSPQKPLIQYDDFSKMDIRVGTIQAAERVPKTDKLMKLTIDTGIDIRTVVSGIAHCFNPEEIIGKQVSILVNLQPRMLKNIESQGMILMAQNSDGKLEFISPVSKVDNGSAIC
ncbi:MAG TPA: methionine--tRNA ligase [Bacteroidales bacterium]|jgi:methionyl-tRNA synthetase|nr:methionine--tRNA ligase [Bacteroidales bacterium]